MGMDDAFRQTGLKLSHFGLLLLIPDFITFPSIF